MFLKKSSSLVCAPVQTAFTAAKELNLCETEGDENMFSPGTSMVVMVSGVSRKSTFPLWKVLL